MPEESGTVFERIMEGMQDALAYVRGEDIEVVEHTFHPPVVPDIADVRRASGLTQKEFAQAFGVSVRTLQGWEQSRREPPKAVQTLILVIEREPEAVRRALAFTHTKVRRNGKDNAS